MTLRIAHRLAAFGQGNSQLADVTKELFSQRIHVVVCDNVAVYVAENERQDFEYHQMPGAVPPWPVTIYEWLSPRFWNFGNGLEEHLGGEAQCGVLIKCQDLDDGKDKRQSLVRWLGSCGGADEYRTLATLVNSARWFCAAFFMIVDSHGRLIPMDGIQSFCLIDAAGTVLRNSIAAMSEDMQAKCSDAETQAGLRRAICTMMATVWITNGMMNCKNVTTVDSTEIDAPSEKWQRRMKTPDIRYSRINIDGFTSEAQRQGGGGDGHAKAWHICRGNFATYTAESPLFGKYVGRYWRPQHVRGDKKLGEVHSTHEIKAPQR